MSTVNICLSVCFVSQLNHLCSRVWLAVLLLTCLPSSCCLSVCLSVCVSVLLSVCLSESEREGVCLRASVCPSVRLSVCLSVSLSVCLSGRLSVCLCLSICSRHVYGKHLLFLSVCKRLGDGLIDEIIAGRWTSRRHAVSLL